MPWQADLELSPTLESRTNKKGAICEGICPLSVSDSKVFQMSALGLDSFTTSFMSPAPVHETLGSLRTPSPYLSSFPLWTAKPLSPGQWKANKIKEATSSPIPIMQILGRLIIIGWSDRYIFAAWPWEDMFIAHIGGMDCLARGLIGACKLVQEGLMKKALESRPSPWDNGNETLDFWETWQNLLQRRASLDYWNQDQEKDCSQDKGGPASFSLASSFFHLGPLRILFSWKKICTCVALVENKSFQNWKKGVPQGIRPSISSAALQVFVMDSFSLGKKSGRGQGQPRGNRSLCFRGLWTQDLQRQAGLGRDGRWTLHNGTKHLSPLNRPVESPK